MQCQKASMKTCMLLHYYNNKNHAYPHYELYKGMSKLTCPMQYTHN